MPGLASQSVREIVRDNLETIIVPYLYDEARELVAGHHTAGRDVIVVSASGHEVVDPIGALLGADTVIATQMVIADGRYTGDVAFYAFGEAKAAKMRALAATRGYPLADCYAYSDSITDLPMLEAVGHPTAVNPDRSLRRAAARRGWPVQDFTVSPVGPRSRETTSSRHVIPPSDRRHELMTAQAFASPADGRRKDSRTPKRPGTAARNPRATSHYAAGCALGTPAHSACDGALPGAPFA